MESKNNIAWERVLWKKQPFPDNYVPPDFFRVTKKRQRISACAAIAGCTAVTLEICSCFWMVAMFFGLQSNNLQPHLLLSSTLAYSIIGYIINKPGVSVLQMAVLIIALCGGLSPVIQSLTASVATDTVYACTTLLLILHVAIRDYGVGVSIANETLSHNVGVFACICLASRLADYWQVFSFTVTGIVVFARREPQDADENDPSQSSVPHSSVTSSTLAVPVVLCTGAAMLLFIPPMLLLYCASIALANFIMPLLYVYMQKYRQNIYGPWDEAKIQSK